MKNNILTKLICLTLVAVMQLSAYAQEQIYLVKDNKIIATYGADEVDYLTFDPTGLESDADFVITIDEVDYTLVNWTVTPKDPDMFYYTNIYTRESIEQDYHDSVEEMASSIYDAGALLAGMAGVSTEEFMEQSMLYKGTCEVGYNQLGPGSEYVIVAFGCNPDGTATTSTYTDLDFSTPEIEMVPLTVDFEIDAANNDVVIKAVPSDSSLLYHFDVQEAGNEIDPSYIINQAIWRGGILGKTPEEVIEELSVKGTCSKTFSLEPNTDYEVYAFSVTPEGTVNSEVSRKTFTSGSVLMSDNTFDITVDNIESNSCTFSVTPSNSDDYSVGVLPKSAFEGKTDEEVLEQYIQENRLSVDFNVRNEASTGFYWDGLQSETEYVAFAFGYYHDVVTTPMAKATFTTPATSDPKTWVATFGEVTTEGVNANVNINVNQNDVKYLWHVVDASGTPEQVYEALLSECKRYEDMGINYVDIRGVSGSNEVSFQTTESGDFKFLAVVMDPTTYEFLTDVFFSETFHLDCPASAPEATISKDSVKSEEKSAKATTGVLKLNPEK